MTALTPPAVLAIDAGSGSCRALVFDAAGALLGLARREWTYHPVPGAPGGFDFDTGDGWTQVSTIGALCGLPVAAFEFSLGVWLTVKGFRSSAVKSLGSSSVPTGDALPVA